MNIPRVTTLIACAGFALLSLAPVLAQQANRTISRQEILLTETRPIQGEWEVNKNVTISGHIYDIAGIFSIYRDSHDQVIFDNKENYDFLEANIGWLDHNEDWKGTFQFIVETDGAEAFRSPKMRHRDAPLPISVPIKGKRGIKLFVQADSELYQFNRFPAVWANPKFIKGKPSNLPPPPTSSGGPVNPPGDNNGTKVLRLDPEKIEDLAAKLKLAVAEDSELSKTKPKLAIAKFILIPAGDLAASNADNVREDLSTALINTKTFALVERGQLEKAMEELKINQKDTFDSAKAQQLGKLIGARLVLIGSISDRDGKYTVINARLIDTQTGEIHSAARVEIRQ